jgi:hypothetical protein
VLGYLKLRSSANGGRPRIDWPGNVTFGLGLILIMVGITYGIEPYGAQHGLGESDSSSAIGVGVALMVAFCVIETKVAEPMFRLQLFKIRAFTPGSSPASWPRSAGAA